MNKQELSKERDKLKKTLLEYGYSEHQIEQALNKYGVSFIIILSIYS